MVRFGTFVTSSVDLLVNAESISEQFDIFDSLHEGKKLKTIPEKKFVEPRIKKIMGGLARSWEVIGNYGMNYLVLLP